MLKKVPLAANPNRAMLITRKDRWFHWLTEKTRASRTSKASVEADTRKTAVSIKVSSSSGWAVHRGWKAAPTGLRQKELISALYG